LARSLGEKSDAQIYQICLLLPPLKSTQNTVCTCHERERERAMSLLLLTPTLP
jgi:hypothetical protein